MIFAGIDDQLTRDRLEALRQKEREDSRKRLRDATGGMGTFFLEGDAREDRRSRKYVPPSCEEEEDEEDEEKEVSGFRRTHMR